jgi:hypothetical protein
MQMNRPATIAFVLLFPLLSSCSSEPGASAADQSAPATSVTVPPAAPEDVATIDATIAALYDVISGAAGEARDWDRFRSLFAPEARLIPTSAATDSTSGSANYMTPEQYVSRAGAMLEERGFFEGEVGRVTERFENIAHAFSTYESRWTAEGDVFQRGINSIQLMWDGERWWVTNIMWRGVDADATIPDQYLQQR